MTLRTSLTQIVKNVQLRPSQASATGRLERFGQQQFDEYRAAGLGAERRLLSDAGVRTNEDVTRIGSEASDLVDRAFTASRGTLSRQQRALGVNLTDREKASQQRRFGLAKVLSDVDSRNRALQADQSRREQLRVSAGSLRDIISQGALSGLSGAASAETARDVQYEQAKAEHDQKKAAGLGQLAGIALSFVPGLGMVNAASGNALGNKLGAALA